MSRPVVLSTYPAANAVNVEMNPYITATFDQAMDPATIGPVTFVVIKDGTYVDTVTGTVTYDAPTRRAVFAPHTYLTESTAYRATLFGSSIKNILGEAMLTNPTWSFTVGLAVDLDPTGVPVDDEDEDSEDVTSTPVALDIDDATNIDESWGVAWEIAQDAAIEIYFTDDLWIEDPADASGVLPAAAISDPQTWLEGSITIAAEATVGNVEAGFVPTAPTFDVVYDEDENKIVITPTSSGYVSSSYSNGSYSAGTLTASRWEAATDYEVTIRKNRLVGLETSIMEEKTFYFTTVLSPMYSSVAAVKLMLGSLVLGVPDLTIAAHIVLNSIAVTGRVSVGAAPADYIRRWVACKTALDLLNAVALGVGMVGSGKRVLGDMSISSGGGDQGAIIKSLTDQLLACIKAMELIMVDGKSPAISAWVIPHDSDPRFPGRDSTWQRLNKMDDVEDLAKPGNISRAGRREAAPFIRKNV